MRGSKYLVSRRLRTLTIMAVGILLSAATLVAALGLSSASDTLASAGGAVSISKLPSLPKHNAGWHGLFSPLDLSFGNRPQTIDAYGSLVIGPSTVVRFPAHSIYVYLFLLTGSNYVTGAQNYLTFTNSILQNIDPGQPGCVLTNAILPNLVGGSGHFDALLQNEVCNSSLPCDFGRLVAPPGSIAFASGTLVNPPVPPNYPVMPGTAYFCASTIGTAHIHWQFSPPAPYTRDSEIIDPADNIVSNPAQYSDGTIDIVTGTLTGHVTWQWVPSQQQPISLTLKMGTTEVNYPAQTTDPTGYFTVSLGSLPDGIYSWRVRGPRFLSNSGTINLSSPPTYNIEMGTMRAGDCNDDNIVNASDFVIVRNAFGTTIGDPGYDARADFTGDNFVNIRDFGLFRTNYGIAGAPPVGPQR